MSASLLSLASLTERRIWFSLGMFLLVWSLWIILSYLLCCSVLRTHTPFFHASLLSFLSPAAPSHSYLSILIVFPTSPLIFLPFPFNHLNLFLSPLSPSLSSSVRSTASRTLMASWCVTWTSTQTVSTIWPAVEMTARSSSGMSAMSRSLSRPWRSTRTGWWIVKGEGGVRSWGSGVGTVLKPHNMNQVSMSSSVLSAEASLEESHSQPIACKKRWIVLLDRA